MANGANRRPKRGYIGIGLLGIGVVGSGVADALITRSAAIADEAGLPLRLLRVAVRDTSRPRAPEIDPALITNDINDVLNDPDVDIVIELIGGEDAALPAIRAALAAGKSVVTGNKEVMAKHGAGLLGMAERHGVALLFEAAVGGGIPLIATLRRGLAGTTITALRAIINGTTNYILSRMAADGIAFEDALAQAQARGYAEADPGNDVDGVDAAYKLAVLAMLAFRTPVPLESVYCEGIGKLAARDFRYAHDLGYTIKLLAIAKQTPDGAIDVRVHPAFLDSDLLLAKVSGVHNAVQFDGDPVGELLLYGRGAGSAPTTSAVLSDVIEVARDIAADRPHDQRPLSSVPKPIRPIDQLEVRYYVRMTVTDSPGVLGAIAQVLGDAHISMASVFQQETDETAQSAEIVIMTHKARESAIRDASLKLTALDVVKEIGSVIRVEE